MIQPENYEKADLHIYNRLIGKLMYIAYDIRPNVAFAVWQLSKHNADARKSYL